MARSPQPPLRSIDGIHARVPAKSKSSIKTFVRRLRKRPRLSALLLLVATGIIIAGLLVIFHNRTGDSSDVNQVIAQVSKHYVLPTKEIPALATVTDNTKLKTEFFKTAKNGDKILIYQTNKIAIIYRPSIDRIVAVGPVSIQAPTNGTGSSN